MTLVDSADVIDQSKSNGVMNHHQNQMKMNGGDHHHDDADVDVDRENEEEGFKKEMRDLAEMLSKLNPMAEEFVPPSLSNNNNFTAPLFLPPSNGPPFGYSAAVNDFMLQTNQTQFPNINGGLSTRRV